MPREFVSFATRTEEGLHGDTCGAATRQRPRTALRRTSLSAGPTASEHKSPLLTG